MTTPERLLEQLEAAERAATGPPAGAGDRVWSTIETRLEGGPAPPQLDQGPLLEPATGAAAAKAGGASSSVVLKLVGALVLVGVVGGGLALLLREPKSEPRPPPAQRLAVATDSAKPEPEQPQLEPVEVEAPPPVPAEPTPEVEPPPEPEPEPEPEQGRSGAPSKAEVAPKPAPAPEKPAPAEPKTLADEVALMQALSTALKQGDSSKVMTLVAEHERDFPKGQFIEERRAAKARGLCQSGRLSAGLEQAQSFAARWPKSIHLAAVQQDCGLE